jgi:phage-related protein
MALTISDIVKVEKNKLTADSAFLFLLEVNIPSLTETIRVVQNNEDIIWNGETWQKFPFDVGEISDTSNLEVSTFAITVSNVYNQIGQYIRQYDIWLKQNPYQPIEATLYIVNSKDLANTNPVVAYNLTLASPTIATKIVFTFSSIDVYSGQIPKSRMMRNACRFKFKNSLCGYIGEENSCNGTLKRCIELGNSPRFGGSPTIGNIGVKI